MISSAVNNSSLQDLHQQFLSLFPNNLSSAIGVSRITEIVSHCGLETIEQR